MKSSIRISSIFIPRLEAALIESVILFWTNPHRKKEQTFRS